MLRIENLSVEYFLRNERIQALRNVTLEIAAGESLGLVGESGSGKSTMALSILRLIRPREGRITSGRILFNDRDLLTMPDNEMRKVRGGQIAMIFQDPFTSMNPVLSIQEQLQEMLDAHPEVTTQTRLSLAGALERVQLDPAGVLHRYPHQLSGGQRQRVMIAMALLCNPKLILADEPTTALDVLIQKDILDLLFRLQRDLGVALLFVSHNLALIGQYAQRMAVMRNGAILESGATQEVLKHPQHPYTQELQKAVPHLRV